MSTTSTTTAHTAVPSDPSPVAAPAALLAAAGFAVEGVISLVHHTGDQHWDALSQVLNVAYLVAAVALVVALPGLSPRLGLRRVGRGGIIAAQVGFAAMAVESVVSSVHDGNTLGGLFFGGLLLSLAGLLALGIDGLLAGRRRWAALLPFLGMFVGIAGGNHGGSVVTAVVWVVLGLWLLRAEA